MLAVDTDVVRLLQEGSKVSLYSTRYSGGGKESVACHVTSNQLAPPISIRRLVGVRGGAKEHKYHHLSFRASKHSHFLPILLL